MMLMNLGPRRLPSLLSYTTAFVLAARSFASDASSKVYRVRQVHVVHRHGDRSPITPLNDEDFWSSTLVPPPLLEKIGLNTHVIRNQPNGHKAGGRGPFGKLSELGLYQMINVGNTLRERFATDQTDHKIIDEQGCTSYPCIWTPECPLEPSNIRVYCTDFARTIQSVQGLLVGLFPDGTKDSISIDVRHTPWMIPDPQPRHTKEQEVLEKYLARRPHVLAREEEMRPLAMRATNALRHMLAHDAHKISFGVEEEHSGEVEIELQRKWYL
jgi:hypothetical protein